MSFLSRFHRFCLCWVLILAGTIAAPVSAQASASITLTKNVNASVASPGSQVAFLLTVKNTGATLASNVVLTDSIPSGCTAVEAFNGGVISNGICTWNLGDLAPGATVQVSLLVKIGLSVTGTIGNTAHVTSPQLETPVTSNTVQVKVSADLLPSLWVTKTADVAAAAPGSLVTFILKVRNIGVALGTNIVLTDPIPTGCTPISASAGGVITDGVCTWNLGNLAAGSTAQVALQVKINLEATGSVHNTAQVTSLLGVSISNSVSVRVEVPLPDLVLSKSANVTTAAAGDLVTFTLTVKNTGAGAATNVVLTDPIPAGCTVVSASSGGSIANGVCTWNLGSLAAGATAQVSLQVKINLNATGSIDNTARVVASGLAAVVSNTVKVTIKVSLPALSLSKSANVATASTGDLVSFTLAVKNTGPGVATNVVLTDPIPAGSTFVVASNGGVITNGVCTWNLGDLAAGASVQVTLQVKINLNAAGSISNTARVVCTQLPSGVSSNGVSVTVQAVLQPPTLVLSKSTDAASVSPADLITFTLSVKNTGGSAATNVVLTDPIPAGCTPVSASNGGVIANGVCTWNLGSLAAGASVQVTLQVKVNLNAAGSISNTAKVVAQELVSAVLSNNVQISIHVPLPSLALSKSADVATALPGGLVTFTLTLKNNGGAATNVVLTDVIPAGCTVVSASSGGSIANGVCTWNLGSLAAGATVQVTLQVKINLLTVGSITNTATVTCSQLTAAVASNNVAVKVGLPL